MIQTEKCDHIYLVDQFILPLTKLDWQHVSAIILKVDSALRSLKSHKCLTAAVASTQPNLFQFKCLRFC